MSKSSKPFRIQVAILVCDTPIEPVLRDYGDYFILFQELLKQGFNNLDLSEEDFNEIGVEFIEHQIVGASSFPSLDNIDAVVITGSSELILKGDSTVAKHLL
jgi:GMP synthase (glutamine-hydrolysing)